MKLPEPGPARTIHLTGVEARLLLESLAGYAARTGIPEELRAAMNLAQRIEGFEIDGRRGAFVDKPSYDGDADG